MKNDHPRKIERKEKKTNENKQHFTATVLSYTHQVLASLCIFNGRVQPAHCTHTACGDQTDSARARTGDLARVKRT